MDIYVLIIIAMPIILVSVLGYGFWIEEKYFNSLPKSKRVNGRIVL